MWSRGNFLYFWNCSLKLPILFLLACTKQITINKHIPEDELWLFERCQINGADIGFFFIIIFSTKNQKLHFILIVYSHSQNFQSKKSFPRRNNCRFCALILFNVTYTSLEVRNIPWVRDSTAIHFTGNKFCNKDGSYRNVIKTVT